jgi:hypothetical protein
MGPDKNHKLVIIAELRWNISIQLTLNHSFPFMLTGYLSLFINNIEAFGGYNNNIQAVGQFYYFFVCLSSD